MAQTSSAVLRSDLINPKLPANSLFISNLPYHLHAGSIEGMLDADDLNCVHVEVPKRGPTNRAEPAGLAILSFDTPEDLEATETKWQDKVIGGRLLQLSRTGFAAAPHEVAAAAADGSTA